MPNFSVQYFNPFFRDENLNNTSSGKFFQRLFFVFRLYFFSKNQFMTIKFKPE